MLVLDLTVFTVLTWTMLHSCFRTDLSWSLSSWLGPILQEVTTVTQLLASGQAPGINRLTFITSAGGVWRLCLHDSLYTFSSTNLLTLKCILLVFSDQRLNYTLHHYTIYFIIGTPPCIPQTFCF